MTELTAAALVAMALSFVVFATAVAWYAVALATLYALRFRWRSAIPLAWVFVVATVLDLSNAAVMGIREDLFDKATDVSWLILTFYVPALWVSVVLVAWRLWTREGSGSLTLRYGLDQGKPIASTTVVASSRPYNRSG